MVIVLFPKIFSLLRRQKYVIPREISSQFPTPGKGSFLILFTKCLYSEKFTLSSSHMLLGSLYKVLMLSLKFIGQGKRSKSRTGSIAFLSLGENNKEVSE